MTKPEVLKLVKQAFEIYDQTYNKRNFLVLYKASDNSIDFKAMVFNAKQFLHLTGLIYKDPNNRTYFTDDNISFYYIENNKKIAENRPLKDFRRGNLQNKIQTYYIQGNAQSFYKECSRGTLSPRRIDLKDNGTTRQKLEVFIQLRYLMTSPNLLGYFNENGYELRADYFIGNSRKTVAIGFKNELSYDIPKTLLSKDLKLITGDPYPVISIYSKKISDTSYSLMYQSKSIPLDLTKLPPKISSMIH